MLNDEEVEDFGGLESSLTRTEDAGTGAEEQSAPQAGPGEDPAGCGGGCPGWQRPYSGDCSFVGGRVMLGSLGLDFFL
jgi:hypothetical protein